MSGYTTVEDTAVAFHDDKEFNAFSYNFLGHGMASLVPGSPVNVIWLTRLVIRGREGRK